MLGGMFFSSAAISGFLLASAVLADRSHEYRKPRSLDRIQQIAGGAASGVAYNNNWAGAIWDADNGTFNYITGTFTAPVLSGPNGSGTSVWVGIDGDTCQNSIFRAGVDFIVDKTETSYVAWLSWYPDDQRFFPDFSISAGDIIRVTVAADSSTTGKVTVENLTKGKAVHKPSQSILALCGQNAEWIVEDFGEGDNLTSYANFGSVTFTDARATGPTGRTYKPVGATLLEVKQSHTTLTSVSVNESSLTIEYALSLGV